MDETERTPGPLPPLSAQSEATYWELEVQRLQAIYVAEKGHLDSAKENRKTVDELAIFLRQNYAAEIQAGEHTGLTMEQTIIRYLQRERNRVARLPKRILAAVLRGGK